jgi:hypothetical protein
MTRRPLAALGLLAALALLGCSTTHAHAPATGGAPSTASTTSFAVATSLAPETTAAPPTTVAPPASVLASYLAAHPEAASHSGPVPSAAGAIAVVGLRRGSHDHVIEVLDLDGGTAHPLAELTLPEPSYEFATDAVEVADVTGDGQPDFLVRVSAGDNDPGVVVSDDGGSWRLVEATRGPAGSSQFSDVYVARDPSYVGAHLLSTYDDCTPDCADGHSTTLTWTYQRQDGSFHAP